MTLDHLEQAANQIGLARQRALIDNLPDHLVPQDEDNAYSIQEIRVPRAETVGWKVSPPSPSKPFRCAPIARSAVIENGGVVPGYLGVTEIEVEVALVLGEDIIPGDRPLARDRLAASIAGACLAVEVLGSCFTDRKRVPELCTLADQQSNSGLILGPISPDWQEQDLEHVTPVLSLNLKETVTVQKPMPSTQAIYEALRRLAAHAARRGRPLRRDQVVITGARVGPIPLNVGDAFTASVEGFGSVSGNLLRP